MNLTALARPAFARGALKTSGAIGGLLALAASLWQPLPAGAQTADAAPAAAASAPVALIAVQRYDVQGNTLLDAAAINERLAGYLGEQPLRRIQEAAAALQELYRRSGYGGVVAFLPEQSLDSGVVRLRVIEGRLKSVDVTGLRQFSSEGINAALPSLVVGRTPRLRELDAEIQLANENPARNLQVLLQPGREPGAVAAQVTVTEQPVQRYTLRLENTGSESTGQWRVAAGWQHANVLGRDHVAGLEFQTSLTDPAALQALSGSYRVPLYGRGMTLDGYGAWSKSKAANVVTEAGAISFSGDGLIVGGRLNLYLPRAGNLDQRLVAGLEWREYGNQCVVDGLETGSCGAGGADISLQPATLSYIGQWAGSWRLQGSASLVANLGLGGRAGGAEDFAFARAGAKPRYTLVRLNASASVPLEALTEGTSAGWMEGMVLSLRAGLQATGSPLVSGEQYGIGGASSVRGFDERQFIGDNGQQASVELTGPSMAGAMSLLPPWARPKDLRLIAFVDAGAVSNTDSRPCHEAQQRCTLLGAGLGLRGGGDDWSLRLDLAGALKSAQAADEGAWKLHAFVQMQF